MTVTLPRLSDGDRATASPLTALERSEWVARVHPSGLTYLARREWFGSTDELVASGEALAADLLDDVRGLVSQLVDEVLPDLRHALDVEDERRERLEVVAEFVSLAWGNLTVALHRLGRDVRPDVVEVTDL